MSWKIWSAAVLSLALSGAVAGEGAALTAVVTWVEGNVEVLGAGAARDSVAVRDQVVRAGVTLKIPAGGLAVVVCSSRQILRLAGPQTWPLQPETCAKGRPLQGSEYDSLAPQAGRFKVVRDLLVLERDARGDDGTDALAPALLSPRNTLVRSPRPTITWTRVPSATEYEVVWTGRGAGGEPLRLDADQVDCTASMDGMQVCSLPWPADRPDLPPGGTFFLSVAAREGIVAPWHASPEVTVRTLEIGAAKDLEGRLHALEDLGLVGAALDAARGGLLAEAGLFADAAEAYRKALAAAPSPALRVTLADIDFMTGLHRLAAPLYRQAQAEGDPAVRAAATFGLGRLEYAAGNFREAAELFQEARQLYAGQNLTEEADAAGQAAKMAKKRSLPSSAASAAPPASSDGRATALALKEQALQALNESRPADAAALCRRALPLAQEAGDGDLQARLLNNLGLALKETEGEEKAREAFEQSLAVARKNGEGSEAVEALALANLADLDLAKGDARSALPRLERAAAIVRRLGPPPAAARVLSTLAQVYDALGDRKEAVKLYTEAVPAAQASGNKTGEAAVRLGLGMELVQAGQAQQAIEPLQQVLSLARDIKAEDLEAGALQGLALAYEQLRDAARETETARTLLEVAGRLGRSDLRAAAERHLQAAAERSKGKQEADSRSREIEEALGRKDRITAARKSLDLGLELLGQDRIAECAQALDRGLVLAGEAQDRETQSLALYALLRLQGNALTGVQSEMFDPLPHMIQAAEDLGLAEVQAGLRVSLGMTYVQKGEARLALDPLEKGLAITQSHHLQEVELNALETLVTAQLLLEDRAGVRHAAERLLVTATRAGDKRRIANALGDLAGADLEEDDAGRARERLEQALTVLGQEKDLDAEGAMILGKLALARNRLGDYNGARAAWNDEREILRRVGDRKREALALQALAGVTLVLGDRPGARKLFDEALLLGRSLDDPGLQAVALFNLGALTWKSEPGTAREALEQLLVETQKPGLTDPRMEAIARGFLARACANLGDAARAAALADAAVTTAAKSGQGFDRAIALDHRAYVHFIAGRLPQAEADARAALELFEADEEKIGTDEIAKTGASDQISTLPDLLVQILLRAGKPAEALEIAERRRARAFREAVTGRPAAVLSAAGLAETARQLRATVVEYSILYDPTDLLLPVRLEGKQPDLETDLVVWVVRPDGTVAHRQVDLRQLRKPGGSGLNEQVGILLKSLESKQPDSEIRPLLRGLYDLLIAPVAGLLHQDALDAPVVLVPQGKLFLVPFAALLDPEGRPLVQSHILLTVPSIAALQGLRRPGPRQAWSGTGALVVGNPRTAKLRPLPSAEQEAKGVASEIGVQPLLGEQATKAAVLQALPQARFVHLATHGLLEKDGQSPLPGALAFAPSAGSADGLLTAAEIRTQHLAADLVVLSACDTGQGRITGDGVFGLSRSFLAAGAAGVVMSLWRIDDEATAALMVDFYRRLKMSGDPARSLRGAMLAAIQHGESPWIWGAFTYAGAP